MNTKNKNYKINKSQQKKSYKRPLLIAALILLSVLVTIVLLEKTGVTDFYQKPKSETPSSTENTINYNPPTEEEQQGAEDNKQAIIDDKNTNNESSPQNGEKRKVTPVINSVDSSFLTGYVTGVFEDGGTCTAKYTKDGSSFTKTSEGFGNASYTQCTPMTYDPASFPSKGTWTVVLFYESITSRGISIEQKFEVQ